jgi:hypothetical protein
MNEETLIQTLNSPADSNSYLDIAVVCEHKDDLKMAEKVAAKAVKIKKDCQGADFPNFYRYTDVLDRIKAKLGKQETEDRV